MTAKIALISLTVYSYQLFTQTRIADIISELIGGFLPPAVITIVAILLTPIIFDRLVRPFLRRDLTLKLSAQVVIYSLFVGIFLFIYLLILGGL